MFVITSSEVQVASGVITDGMLDREGLSQGYKFFISLDTQATTSCSASHGSSFSFISW